MKKLLYFALAVVAVLLIANAIQDPNSDAGPDRNALVNTHEEPSDSIAPPPSAQPTKIDGTTITVSGSLADSVQIKSFHPKNETYIGFAADVRLHNPNENDIEFLDIKVTALRGNEIIATADGFMDELISGQTSTTQAIGTDKLPHNTKGIRYEVEID